MLETLDRSNMNIKVNNYKIMKEKGEVLKIFNILKSNNSFQRKNFVIYQNLYKIINYIINSKIDFKQ